MTLEIQVILPAISLYQMFLITAICDQSSQNTTHESLNPGYSSRRVWLLVLSILFPLTYFRCCANFWKLNHSFFFIHNYSSLISYCIILFYVKLWNETLLMNYGVDDSST